MRDSFGIIESFKMLCNRQGRMVVLQCPECFLHFQAGIQHSEISQIQGRAYLEEKWGWVLLVYNYSCQKQAKWECLGEEEDVNGMNCFVPLLSIERISVLFSIFQPSEKAVLLWKC